MLAETEETVSSLETLSGLNHWKLELSSFLKELKCPHTALHQADLDSRLGSQKDRLILVNFLLDEILAARLAKFRGAPGSEVQSSTATHLAETLKALELQPPPANVTPQMLFGKLAERIGGIEDKKRDKLIGKPLFVGGKLSDKQWQILSQVRVIFLVLTLVRLKDHTDHFFHWPSTGSCDHKSRVLYVRHGGAH